MPVNSTNAQYNEHIEQWQRCRDVICGQDAIHARGETYLPKLIDQEPKEYENYVKRATFYNATWRTIAGLVGMLFRKPPQIDVPDAVAELLQDVTLSGTPFPLFLQEVSLEVLGSGRVGVLVDYTEAPKKADGTALTQADAKAMQLRPTMQLYRTESIINWRCGQSGSAKVLTMVVLKERHPVSKDEYVEELEDRYRVLDLDPSGFYRVRVFKCDATGREEQIGSDVYPLMSGKKLPYVPFVIIGPDGLSVDAGDPPLIDLVNLNLSHYRTNADYEHAAHFVGLPTPVITGYTPTVEGEKLYIGSGSAWILRDPAAKAFFLEFTGQGLSALKEILSTKEQQMAVLGARMLEPRMKGVESAEAASIHRKGEESMLSSVAQAISLGAEQALTWFTEWAEQDATEIDVEVNRDFYPAPMSPLMLTSLVSAWQTGAISDQTLFDNLQAGEIISESTTLEDEQAAINTAPPKLVVQPGATGENKGLPPAKEKAAA